MRKLGLKQQIERSRDRSMTGNRMSDQHGPNSFSKHEVIGFSGLAESQGESSSVDDNVKFRRGISIKLRSYVLDHYDFYCQMCGVVPGDIDDVTGRKVRLHIGHIVDKNLGGKDELSNLRTLCSTCNQGAKNITGEKPTTIWLLSQVRRAGQDEQRAVLASLLKKFGSGD